MKGSAGQLALFEPPTRYEHFVELNEGTVDASRQGSDWWYLGHHRQRLEIAGRIREVKSGCITGGIIEIRWDSEDDAQFALDHMISQGIPRTAVRLIKRKAPP